MMKVAVGFGAVFLATLLQLAISECPHDKNGLTHWSTIHETVKSNQTVSITNAVLLDRNVSLFGIKIESNGKLVVDPSVQSINVYYILVEGEFHIGSKDCHFPGKLTVTMMGKIADNYTVDGLTCKKCVNVKENGVLELHGKFKRPWTKLAATLNKISKSDILYSKKEDKSTGAGAGLFVRTFDSETGELTGSSNFNFRRTGILNRNLSSFKQLVHGVEFGLFGLKSYRHLAVGAYCDVMYFVVKGSSFSSNAVTLPPADNDDCVVLSVRKSILRKGDTNKDKLGGLYDEIEKLGYGNVTNQLCLREHTFYDAFAMVVCKGDKSLTTHSCGKYRLGNRQQSVEECVVFNDLKFCGTSFSNSRSHGKSFAIFEVTTFESSVPKLALAQKPSNWVIGDEICVTSTDYDWKQIECGKIVECSDCSDTEVRVGFTPRYTHYGHVTNNVDMRAEVLVNTRNIQFTSDMESFNAENGGMIKYDKGFKFGNIENIEVENFGDSSQLGIYPIHYHLCNNTHDTTYVKNSAIHDSWSRCVVIHGTLGAVIDWNTCYVCQGHAFFTEDGGEKDTVITNNLGVGTLRANPSIFTQLDRHPATFFISNPEVEFKGNIAAGGVANGIFVIFPSKPTGPSSEMGFMEKNQAKKTPMKIENTVVHSYSIGFRFDGQLDYKNRKTMQPNQYQPKDSNDNPDKTEIIGLTAFKNMEMNAYIQGGFIEAENISLADSKIGLEFERGFPERFGNLFLFNDGKVREEPGQKPCLTNAVIIGDSDNVGNPEEGEERSFPNQKDKSVPRCGMMVTSGVWSVDNTWFGGFYNDVSYETGAICTKPKDAFPVSPRNTFKNVEFGFDDPDEGSRILNLASQSLNITQYVGSKVAIFYDEQGKVTEQTGAYVLQPTAFHESTNGAFDPYWDMEVSEENFAQVRVVAKVKEVTMMRNNFEEETSSGRTTAFNVITGSENHYIIKFSEYSKGFMIGGVGITKDKTVLLGVCIPRGSSPIVKLFQPSLVSKPVVASNRNDMFTGSYDYFWDSTVGVVLFQMKHSATFAADDVDECPKGKCSRVTIHPNAQNNTADLDCYERYRDTYLVDRRRQVKVDRRRQVKRDEDEHNLPGSVLDKDWGAKEFPLRD